MNRCVYTVLTGDHWGLTPQPVIAKSSYPFICFTDDPSLVSDEWDIRVINPILSTDPTRSQREIKHRPHLYLPEYDQSLYIDNTVLLHQTPERIFERLKSDVEISLPGHSYRSCVYDEFIEVALDGLDEPSRIFEQLNHYLLDDPKSLMEKPFWTAIIIRNHMDPLIVKLGELWFLHVLRYSRRDQLSLVYLLRKLGISPNCIDIDNYHSSFHSWPHHHKDRLATRLYRYNHLSRTLTSEEKVMLKSLKVAMNKSSINSVLPRFKGRLNSLFHKVKSLA